MSIVERFGFSGMLLAAWRYREFILSSIRADYRARFVRSRLGTLWMIVHPLVNAAIFALVLAEVMQSRIPAGGGGKFDYALYLMAGMLAWSLFADVVTRCLTIFIDNGNLLKKLQFPRICLPIIAAGSALLANVLLFAAILAIFTLLGNPPRPTVLWVPALMIVPLALGVGVGLLFAIFNVFVRDVGQVVPVLLQLGFWFTPIVYLPSLLPERFVPLLRLNPMTPIVQSYQNVMVWHSAPAWPALAWVVALAVALLAMSLFVFRRASVELVDAL